VLHMQRYPKKTKAGRIMMTGAIFPGTARRDQGGMEQRPPSGNCSPRQRDDMGGVGADDVADRL